MVDYNENNVMRMTNYDENLNDYSTDEMEREEKKLIKLLIIFHQLMLINLIIPINLIFILIVL